MGQYQSITMMFSYGPISVSYKDAQSWANINQLQGCSVTGQYQLEGCSVMGQYQSITRMFSYGPISINYKDVQLQANIIITGNGFKQVWYTIVLL